MSQGDHSTTSTVASTVIENLDSQTRFQIAQAAFTRLKEYGTGVLKDRKPWTELLDRSSFARPPTSTEALSRIRQNLQYFRINYLIILMVTVVTCMIMSPKSLFVLLALFSGWTYVFIVRTAPLIIAGRTLGEREKLIGMSALTFIIVFFLTNVGTVILSSVIFGCSVIAIHGATRVPDDLFIDDSQAAPSFWSIIKGEQRGQAKIATVV